MMVFPNTYVYPIMDNVDYVAMGDVLRNADLDARVRRPGDDAPDDVEDFAF